MITFEEALTKILERMEAMPVTSATVRELAGHVIAENVIARIDSPPFDNSAVDGFGVKVADVANVGEASPVKLSLKGVIRAGDRGDVNLAPGSAIKILTGATVPPTVDAVVMKEFCNEKNGNVEILESVKAGENIRRRGGEFLRGQEIVRGGLRATPPVVGLIANLGYRTFPVYRKPKAAVITTGNELTKPGRDLMPGKIFDSNSYAMSAAVRACGIEDVLSLHAAEDERSTRDVFHRALGFADVIVSTGGVSVGDYDFVKAALESLHVETHIWKIAMKPGKPVYFGVYTTPRNKRKRYVFGLPGNPVSALVTFRTLVVPAVAKLMGVRDCADELIVRAELTSELRKKAGRLEFVRGRLKHEAGKLYVQPTVGQDSHMLGGLATANALITFPLEAEKLPAGQSVEVRLLNW
ncbi:MAG TPA: gephyrin-like molybdotransferase Glp [Candidatus Obscuribacterales bacterium]